MSKIINKIKLFFFHLWWGKGAIKILFANRISQKGDIMRTLKTNIIILSNPKKVGNNYEYIVKPIK